MHFSSSLSKNKAIILILMSFDTLGPGKRYLEETTDKKGMFGPSKCKIPSQSSAKQGPMGILLAAGCPIPFIGNYLKSKLVETSSDMTITTPHIGGKRSITIDQ